MGKVIRFVPKSERERARLIREARAIYDSIFPPADPVSEQQDKAPVSHPVSGTNAYRSDDARLRDLKPELERFAVDARRAPKRIFDAHPPDQYAQLRVDLRSPSLWARLPTPVAAKAGPVPTHERLGPDDGEKLQD